MAEIPKNKSKLGGARPGAGRPKGGKNAATLEKERVFAEMRCRIAKSTDKLLNAQMNLAEGCQYLYVIKTITDSNGKKTKQRPEIVERQSIIEKFLAGELDQMDDEYYYLTTEKPDNKALDSLFDRTFGKAQQNIDVKSNGKVLATVDLDKLLEVYVQKSKGHTAGGEKASS